MSDITYRTMEVHDLAHELEALDLLGLQGMCEEEALRHFQACANELQVWTPNEQMTTAELMHGLSHMIIGAFSLHNHADMQRMAGKVGRSAETVPFNIAQCCLRKAVAVMEIAMRNTARDAMGPLSPDEAGTREPYH